ncbi:MAG TPA: YraN family protein [Candidatus Bilophila faecipullorum]|uniref:UPF0102 protein H9874_00665 n=1 Tax=Candidatus Bilophila faecipullorum TaxID=2838482 RepID=A0A9D1QYR2_9BACT|nr:YraN family protein [uncultured Bilophila sp.]HIW77645.1 YraN family protein [Candidatus Bilophila faecipullorum]
MNVRYERGRAGEAAAAAYLEEAGLRIIARNWRGGPYELDLVCEDGETLVFVEVRTRGRRSLASAEESLSPVKCRNVVKAARAYLTATGLWDRPCRFDLVCVCDAGATPQLDYYRHVFDISEIMGSGDAAWQPW